MIFQCNKSIFVSRSVYSVIDSQLRCDLLVFFMDISYGIRMGYFVGLCDVLFQQFVVGNCLQSSVIYQATVTRNDNNTTETYIELTENDFKTQYRNHTASLRHAKHKNSTELSKHIWTLKDNNIDHSILWRILSSSSSYNSSNKRYNLCLKEKILIICRPDLSSLNKRNELVSSCRHRNKALLRNN